eukprot:jgi/Bigna1/87759/estExt_fgenesh1_pg.C_230212
MVKKQKNGTKLADTSAGSSSSFKANGEIKPSTILAKVQEKQYKDMKERSSKAARKAKDLEAYIAELEDKSEAEISRLLEENRRKSRETEKLNRRLRELLDQNRDLRKGNSLEVAKAVAATRKEGDQKAIDIRKENSKLQKNLKELDHFKETRVELANELEQAKIDMKLLKARNFEKIRDMEHKFLQVKTSKVTSNIKQSNRSECRKIVTKEMELESQKLRILNTQMADEIRFHVQGVNTLRAQNDKLKAKLKQAKLDLDLASQKDSMQASRGAKHMDNIRKMRAANEELENRISALKQEISALKKELVEARKPGDKDYQIDELKHHLTMKIKDLHRIKKLAQRMLDQRGDVERYFLAALEQVKYEIKQKKNREAKFQKKIHTRQLLALTTRKGSLLQSKIGKKRSNSEEPLRPNKRVDISELSPEDRERVLRLLFSKINSAAQAPPLPQPGVGVGSPFNEIQNANQRRDEEEEKDAADNTFLTNFEAEDNNGTIEDIDSAVKDLNIDAF